MPIRRRGEKGQSRLIWILVWRASCHQESRPGLFGGNCRKQYNASLAPNTYENSSELDISPTRDLHAFIDVFSFGAEPARIRKTENHYRSGRRRSGGDRSAVDFAADSVAAGTGARHHGSDR